MKNMIKRETFNDILTGLMVAALFAAVMPADAFAQLDQTVTNSETTVFRPAVVLLGYLSYTIGAVLLIAGVHGCKMHADNPTNNKLGPALGRLGAGACFVVAPYVIGTLQSTGNTTLTGTGTGFQPIQF